MANSVTTAPQSAFADHSSNVIGLLTVAQLTTKYPALTVKTPTKSFTFPWNGHHVSFIKGIPVVCEAGLVAALTAASAPVV